MSRVNLIERLTMRKNKSALEFDYDKLWAPPILSLFTPNDINELKSIATSLRYNGNISKKYEMIDAVMRRRGFRKAHSGTNRVVYNFLESTSFVAKVAIDRVGMTDSPAEFRNQQYFKPFCCKIFEVDPSGVIAFVERVNPISSIEEFVSVADDVFNMMVTKIIGKYVVDDLGTRTYMNFGIRQNSNGYTFGPVIIDFPYVYEIDGAKLFCCHKIVNKETGKIEPCNGEIDYKPGFNGLYCTKCGREYRAMDLAKETNDVKFSFDSTDDDVKKIKYKMRAMVMDGDKIVVDSGRSSKYYIGRKEFESMYSKNDLPRVFDVEETIKSKFKTSKQTRDIYYSALQRQYYSHMYAKRMEEEANDTSEIIEVDTNVNNNNTVKVDSDTNNVYYDYDDEYDSYPYTVVDVDETVGYLEKETFPEIDNEEVPQVINIAEGNISMDEPNNNEINEETNDIAVVTNNNPVYYEEPKVEGSVYSEQQIQDMIDEVASRNQEETGPKEVTVLDEKGDKALENPFIRPYTNMPNDDEINEETNDVEEDNYPLEVLLDYYIMDESKENVTATYKVSNPTNDKIMFKPDDYVKFVTDYDNYIYGVCDDVYVDPGAEVSIDVEFKNIPEYHVAYITDSDGITNIIDGDEDDNTNNTEEDGLYVHQTDILYTSEGLKVFIDVFNDTDNKYTFNSSDFVKMVVDGTDYYGTCEDDNTIIEDNISTTVVFDMHLLNNSIEAKIVSDTVTDLKLDGPSDNIEDENDVEDDQYSEYEDQYDEEDEPHKYKSAIDEY